MRKKDMETHVVKRIWPLILAVAIVTVVALEIAMPTRAVPLSHVYTFPANSLESRQNASALAASMKAALNDSSLDLALHTRSDVKLTVEELGPFYIFASVPTWNGSESWGSPPGSRVTEFYREDSLVFLSYEVRNSKIYASSKASMGATVRETATRLGVPLTGLEQEARIDRAYTADGGLINATEVVLYQRLSGWPLGYSNRFAASFRSSDLQLIGVWFTGWLSFAVPQMEDPSVALDAAIQHAGVQYAAELTGYRLSNKSLTYVAWSWATSRLVYAVWLTYTTPDSARNVWIGVDVTDSFIALSGVTGVTVYTNNQAWQVVAIAVASSAAIVTFVVFLRRRRTHGVRKTDDQKG